MRKSSNVHSWLDPVSTKLIPCFWPIFTDFWNEALVVTLIFQLNMHKIIQVYQISYQLSLYKRQMSRDMYD